MYICKHRGNNRKQGEEEKEEEKENIKYILT